MATSETPEGSVSLETVEILAAPEALSLGIGDFVRPADVPLDALKDSLTSLHRKLSSVLADLPAAGDFECSEFTLTAAITAKGQIQIVGFVQGGGEIQGGVTLKFTRKKR